MKQDLQVPVTEKGFEMQAVYVEAASHVTHS